MSKKGLKKIKLGATIITAVILATLLLIGIVNYLIVSTESLEKLPSPDHAYYVQAVQNNGGATTANYSSIRIVDANSVFKNLGAIGAWTGGRTSIFGFKGQLSSVKTSWVDNRTLKIIYTDCSQIYGQGHSWKDIEIIYEEYCAPSK